MGIRFIVQLPLALAFQKCRAHIENRSGNRFKMHDIEKIVHIVGSLQSLHMGGKIFRVDHHLIGDDAKEVFGAELLQPAAAILQDLLPLVVGLRTLRPGPGKIPQQRMIGQVEPVVFAHRDEPFRGGVEDLCQAVTVEPGQLGPETEMIVEKGFELVGEGDDGLDRQG